MAGSPATRLGQSVVVDNKPGAGGTSDIARWAPVVRAAGIRVEQRG